MARRDVLHNIGIKYASRFGSKNNQGFSENSSGRFPMLLNKSYLLFVSTCDGVPYIDAKGNSGLLSKQISILRQVINR